MYGGKDEANPDSDLYLAGIENIRKINQFYSVLPSIKINDKILRGSVREVDVLDEICNSLLLPPIECMRVREERKHIEIVSHKFTLVFMLRIIGTVTVSGTIVFLLAYLLYTFKLKREFRNRLNNEVDTALSNFYLKNKTDSKEYLGVNGEMDIDDRHDEDTTKKA